MATCRPDIVVSIDFGTTYTGVAFMPLNSEVKILPALVDSPDQKVPTVVAKQSALRIWQNGKWGFSCEDLPEKEKWRFFKLFLDSEDPNGPKMKHNALAPNNQENAAQVVMKYLKGLYSHVSTEIPKCLRGNPSKYSKRLSVVSWEDLAVEFVFSFPTTWKQRVIDRFGNVVHNAGFGKEKNHRAVLGLNEAEAAAVSMLKDDKSAIRFQKADIFLSIDAGGGTTDFTVVEVTTLDPPSMRVIVDPIGIAIGSTNIDMAFSQLVENCLKGYPHPQHLPNNYSFKMSQSEEFQAQKCRFGARNEDASSVLEVPLEKDNVSFYSLGNRVNKGNFRYTWQELKCLFDTQVAGIQCGIETTLDRFRTVCVDKPLKYAFLSGGLGSSDYVSKCLQEYFLHQGDKRTCVQGTKVIRHPNPQLAVALGLLNNWENTLSSRIARVSYGIKFEQPPSKQHGSIKVFNQNSDEIVDHGQIHWLVMKGGLISGSSGLTVRRKMTSEYPFNWTEKMILSESEMANLAGEVGERLISIPISSEKVLVEKKRKSLIKSHDANFIYKYDIKLAVGNGGVIQCDIICDEKKFKGSTPLWGPTMTSSLAGTLATETVLEDLSLARQSQDTASTSVVSPQSPSLDLWVNAYRILEAREPKLITEYKNYFASKGGNATASTDFSRQSINSMVEQLWDHREKRKWRVSIQGYDIMIREQWEKLLEILISSEDTIANILSGEPTSSIVWAALMVLLPMLLEGGKQEKFMLEGFNFISDYQRYWGTFEEKFLTPENRQHFEACIEPLAKLYSYLFEYQVRAICHLSKIQSIRAWNELMHSNDWTGMLENIRDWNLKCSKLAKLQCRAKMQEALDSQTKLLGKLNETVENVIELMKEGPLLENLSKAAANYEVGKDFHPERVPGTCAWFFEDKKFLTWRETGIDRVLWLSVGPGCGKSVLSKALIDELWLTEAVTEIWPDPSNTTSSTSGASVCYFFFKDGENGPMDGAQALCAILHQLFKSPSTNALIQHALLSHKTHGSCLTQNFSELWKILVKCAESSARGITCVLDALDECKSESRKVLVETLVEHFSRPEGSSSKLKFLITSRPCGDLEASFRNFQGGAAYSRVDGNEKSKQISKDIDRVISATVPVILDSFSASDQENFCTRLKRTKMNDYLWLQLIFGIIKKDTNSEYSRFCDLEYLLSSTPSEVSGAYEKILYSNHKQDPKKEKLLQIVLAAKYPLTLAEANCALALVLHSEPAKAVEIWNPTQFRTIVGSLGGLICVYDSKLCFNHQTVKEFVEARFGMPTSHSTMSLACIRMLLGQQLGADLKSYATAHWHLHYTSQGNDSANDSREIALTLCDKLSQQTADWVSRQPSFHPGGNITRLVTASRLGLKPLVQLILDTGVGYDINADYGERGMALQVASAEGHNEIVQMLLKNDAEFKNKATFYAAALRAASSEGHLKIVQMLLEKDPPQLAEALFDASCRGRTEIVQTLLSKGANVHMRGEYSKTSLQIASEHGHKDVAEILLKSGANVNTNDEPFGTALRAASENGHKDVVEMLVENGADLNTNHGYLGTALQAASGNGHKDVVLTLLHLGADVNTKGGQFHTALQAASAYGRDGVVKILLENKADVNAKGGKFQTALQAACAEGHNTVVQMLLEGGADTHIKGGRFVTAVNAASSNGHSEIVGMLEKH